VLASADGWLYAPRGGAAPARSDAPALLARWEKHVRALRAFVGAANLRDRPGDESEWATHPGQCGRDGSSKVVFVESLEVVRLLVGDLVGKLEEKRSGFVRQMPWDL